MTPTTPTQSTEITDADDLRRRLAVAVATGAVCTLRWTAADAGSGETRMARARANEVDRDQMVATVRPEEVAELTAAQIRGRRVMTIFRVNGSDLLFVAPIRRVEGTTVTLDLPDHLMETNRRTSVRVEVGPADAGLAVARAWRIDDRVPLRDRPLASRELTCTVRDLTATGARAVLASKHRAVQLPVHIGDRIRLELTSGEHAMLFDARVRALHALTDVGPWLCGIEFTERRHDVESRRDAERLHKLIAELQRRAFRQAAA